MCVLIYLLLICVLICQFVCESLDVSVLLLQPVDVIPIPEEVQMSGQHVTANKLLSGCALPW